MYEMAAYRPAFKAFVRLHTFTWNVFSTDLTSAVRSIFGLSFVLSV